MAESPPSTTDHDLTRPLVSSQALGWKNILVEEYKTPPGGIAYQAWPEHAIAVCLSSTPNRLQQMIGDRHYTGLYHLSSQFRQLKGLTPRDFRAG